MQRLHHDILPNSMDRVVSPGCRSSGGGRSVPASAAATAAAAAAAATPAAACWPVTDSRLVTSAMLSISSLGLYIVTATLSTEPRMLLRMHTPFRALLSVSPAAATAAGRGAAFITAASAGGKHTAAGAATRWQPVQVRSLFGRAVAAACLATAVLCKNSVDAVFWQPPTSNVLCYYPFSPPPFP